MGGRVPVQAIEDVPCGADRQVCPYPLTGARVGARPSSRSARCRAVGGGLLVAGHVWSLAATAGGAGNATPPWRAAGMAVGAGVCPGLGPLGRSPPLVGRPRGRHLGRTGFGVRDVPGPGPAGVPPPSITGDAPPVRRASASPAAGVAAIAAPSLPCASCKGTPNDRCRALVPLVSRLCAVLRPRPFFCGHGGNGAAAARPSPASAGSVAAPAAHASLILAGWSNALPHDLFIPLP